MVKRKKKLTFHQNQNLQKARDAKKKLQKAKLQKREAIQERREALLDQGLCDWDGSIDHISSDIDDDTEYYTPSDTDEDSDKDLDSAEFAESLPNEMMKCLEDEVKNELAQVNVFQAMNVASQDLGNKEWRRDGVRSQYDKQAPRMKRYHAQKAREKAERDEKARKT